MLRFLFGFDWKKSNAHLLFLSKFLHPRTLEDFAESEVWKTALKENPKQAIKRFLDEGMLEQADLKTKLDYKFKVAELKDMLKKMGLTVSGRKDDLIQRLIQASIDSMKHITAGLSILVCSKNGQKIIDQYILNEEAKRNRIEQQVLEHLQQHKFREASLTVSSYEAEQIFPRGIGIDWKHYDSKHDIIMLNIIFSNKPKILACLNDNLLYSLRLAAGMIYLWGVNKGEKWLPSDFQTGLAMDNDAAIRMLLFHASHLTNMDNYKQSGVVKYVEILATQDSCDACKKISGKRYKLSDVIELPYEHCTHEMGCRCVIIPIVNFC